eukprot:43121-Chlamydomonas_euryale.AAC.1
MPLMRCSRQASVPQQLSVAVAARRSALLPPWLLKASIRRCTLLASAARSARPHAPHPVGGDEEVRGRRRQAWRLVDMRVALVVLPIEDDARAGCMAPALSCAAIPGGGGRGNQVNGGGGKQ